MFDRPPLVEEPFAQTLSGQKKHTGTDTTSQLLAGFNPHVSSLESPFLPGEAG